MQMRVRRSIGGRLNDCSVALNDGVASFKNLERAQLE